MGRDVNAIARLKAELLEERAKTRNRDELMRYLKKRQEDLGYQSVVVEDADLVALLDEVQPIDAKVERALREYGDEPTGLERMPRKSGHRYGDDEGQRRRRRGGDE